MIWQAFENTPDALWVSMPPAAPTDPLVTQGRGPFVVGADIKILDEKNILVGCGVASPNEIKNTNHGRSAMNEDGIKVFSRLAKKLGYEVHTCYYDTSVSFHKDWIVGLIRPGVVAIPKGALFHTPDYLKKNFEIIETPRDEASKDGALNLVNINETTLVVNARAEKTIKLLESRAGVQVEAIDYWVGADLGTCPWCTTCAMWRE